MSGHLRERPPRCRRRLAGRAPRRRDPRRHGQRAPSRWSATSPPALRPPPAVQEVLGRHVGARAYRPASTAATPSSTSSGRGPGRDGARLAGRNVDPGRRELAYDGLVIATGAVPGRLPGPGPRRACTYCARSRRPAIRAALEPRSAGRGRRGRVHRCRGGGAAAGPRSARHPGRAAPVPLGRVLGVEWREVRRRVHRDARRRPALGVGVAAVEGGDRRSGGSASPTAPCRVPTSWSSASASPPTRVARGLRPPLADGVGRRHLRAAPGVGRRRRGPLAPPTYGRTSGSSTGPRRRSRGAGGHQCAPPRGGDGVRPRALLLVRLVRTTDPVRRSSRRRTTISDGRLGPRRVVALYREGDRLAGVLTLDRRGDVMKYRALIARRACWQDALQLAERRRASVRTPAVPAT